MEKMEKINYVWITGNQRKIPVENMSTKHILSTWRCLRGEGKQIIDDDFLIKNSGISRDKWCIIFFNELRLRYETYGKN